MNDKCFVDTNLLVYFRDASEPAKQRTAERWLKKLWKSQSGCISWQVLNEYYVIVTQKLKPGLHRDLARMDIKNLMVWNPVVVDYFVVDHAWMLQDQFRLSWWDALIVSAALKADCLTLLTEDLQHGQSIHGMTIINPFYNK